MVTPNTHFPEYQEHIAGQDLSEEQLLDVLARVPNLLKKPVLTDGGRIPERSRRSCFSIIPAVATASSWRCVGRPSTSRRPKPAPGARRERTANEAGARSPPRSGPGNASQGMMATPSI